MNKILIIDDKTGSAINILSNFIVRHNPQYQIDILSLHPKRPDEATLDWLKQNYQNYDLIHAQYWKSYEKAKELVPGITEVRSILSHYNPYDVTKQNWVVDHREVVFVTEEQRNQVGYGKIIRLGVDEQLWKFEPNDHQTVGMCANRIEGKKGVLEVAQVCKEMGLRFIIIGRISDGNYWQKVVDTKADIEFHEGIPFENMPDVYHSMGVIVCNSVDGFETGPMPMFEASLCGVPVVSRKVGQMAEVYKKGIVWFDTPDELKVSITEAFERREELRNESWNVAKGFNSFRYGVEYGKLYNQVLFGGHKLVSVIVPYIKERAANIERIRESVENQSYKNTELIVVEDNEEGYNLAKVRNEGLIKANGYYVLFLDDRLALKDEHTVIEFIQKHSDRERHFLWGDKGAGKRQFLENFSFTRRQDFINAGMFNERMNVYGGMSQEIRTRLNRQGWIFEYCEEAKADVLSVSKNKWQKKGDILKAKNMLFKMGL